MASVIIPAHNESAVIRRTLQSLHASIGRRSVEVIVVCNGCTDDTADRARDCAPWATVLETATASKRHALNLGDATATSFPRLYLDADIQVSENFITEMFRSLETDQVRAAWPSVNFDLSGCTLSVRAFYGVWTSLPYNQPGRIGVGVYGLSRAARQRFLEFPDVISDDGYIRGLFNEAERLLVRSCATSVQVPLTLGSLIKVRTRSRLGIYELRRKQPDALRGHRTPTTLWDIVRVLLRPSVMWGIPVYLYVNAVVRLRARRQLRQSGNYRWERDESTRVCALPQKRSEAESAHG